MCKFYCGLDSLFMSVSINILVIMCSDRFLAIKRPFRTAAANVLTKAISKVVVALVISTAITSPMFFFSQVTKIKFVPKSPTTPTPPASSPWANASSTPGSNLFTRNFNQSVTRGDYGGMVEGLTNATREDGKINEGNIPLSFSQMKTLYHNDGTQFYSIRGRQELGFANFMRPTGESKETPDSNSPETGKVLVDSKVQGHNRVNLSNLNGNLDMNLNSGINYSTEQIINVTSIPISEQSDYDFQPGVNFNPLNLDGDLRCYLKPPDDQQKFYFVFQYLSIFVVPGILLTWLYLEMLREFRTVTSVLYETQTDTIRIESPQDENTNNSHAPQTVNDRMIQLNLSRKRKVTRIILIIIVLFMVCYLPFSSMVLVQMFLKSSPWRKSWFKILHFVFVTLTYVNSCANPFLYTLLCKRYRIIFVKYFPCRTVNCYCLLPATSDATPTTVKNRRENLVYSARKRAANLNRNMNNNHDNDMENRCHYQPRHIPINATPRQLTPIAMAAVDRKSNSDEKRIWRADDKNQFHIIAIYRPHPQDVWYLNLSFSVIVQRLET